MSKTFEGVVIAKARNGKGLAFNVDGDDVWYNAREEDQIPENVAKDDLVSFEYDVTRKGGRTFNNIKGDVEILEAGGGGGRSGSSRGGGSGGGGGRSGGSSARSSGGGGASRAPAGGGGTDKDRQIVRQNALTQANKLVETFPNLIVDGDNGDTEDVAAQLIAIAKLFEGYVFS